MKQINGNKIFDEGGITVHQHEEGYTISNGNDAIVLSFMPLLDASSLSKMFSASCGFERFQLAKHGNVVKENKTKMIDQRSNAFDIWFTKEMMLEEMYQMGY